MGRGKDVGLEPRSVNCRGKDCQSYYFSNPHMDFYEAQASSVVTCLSDKCVYIFYVVPCCDFPSKHHSGYFKTSVMLQLTSAETRLSRVILL